MWNWEVTAVLGKSGQRTPSKSRVASRRYPKIDELGLIRIRTRERRFLSLNRPVFVPNQILRFKTNEVENNGKGR